MRVFIVHSGNLYGGIETALVSLARASTRQSRVRFDIGLCFADTRVADELRAAGIAVHDLGSTRISRPWTVWRARRRLRDAFRRSGAELCVTPSAWAQALFAPTARAHGMPLALWAHDMWSTGGWLDRRAIRQQPALVVANSRYTAGGMTRLFPEVPVRVVYCPVDAATATPGRRGEIRRQLDTPEDAAVIVQVARLEPYKGHRLLIDALARMTDEPGWRCWFVGGAQRPHELQYLRDLEEAVARLGLAGRVRFAGARVDVTAVLEAADVFCHPNIGPEPFGLVFIEAMRAGLPVVGTSLGGVPEIVTDDCGRLVPAGDVTALASTLRMLIQSPDLRRRLGATGPGRADALCDPDDRLAELVACFDEATARRSC